MEKNIKKQFIYVLKDPTTDEIRYVGKTSNPKDRLSRHLQKSYLDGGDKNFHKSRWIKKLLSIGERPTMSVIQECDDTNVNELEIYWIDKMKKDGHNLTNMSIGGEVDVDWTGRKHTQESINKNKESHKDCSKLIIEYDLSGNILNEYTSLMNAHKKTGYHIYLISKCCKEKKYYTVGGDKFWGNIKNGEPRTFRYKGDIFDYVPYNKNIQINSKKICKYNLDGELLEIYESIRDTSKSNDINKSNISSCCKRKINKKTGVFIVVKKFTFRYFNETLGENLTK